MEIIIVLVVIGVIGYWMRSANAPSVKVENAKINEEAAAAPVIVPVAAEAKSAAVVEVAPAKPAPVKRESKPAAKAPAKPANNQRRARPANTQRQTAKAPAKPAPKAKPAAIKAKTSAKKK